MPPESDADSHRITRLLRAWGQGDDAALGELTPDGFSSNVQDILDNFEFRNQLPRLSKADALGTLIEKFTSAEIDLSPNGLDNHGM